jgi:hypothetical protein
MTGSNATLTWPPAPPRERPDRRAGGLFSSAGWALMMAVADRRNMFRLAMMAFGVGLCTFVLLALVTISPLVDSVNNRAGASLPQLTNGAGSFQTLPVSVSVDSKVVNGMVLRAVAARPPAPPGTARFPGDGQLLVSPALAALLADPTQRTVRAVVPGTVVGVIDPKVLPGPDDLFFYQGSATMVGGQGADGWGAPAGQHPFDPRVWSMLITGVIIVMVPLLLFTALAGRIGAARRDRRSATLRLLGASTGRLRLLIGGEAFLAAVAGLALAGVAYLGARIFVSHVQISGHGVQPGDLTPDSGWAVAIALVIPLVAVAATLTGFRSAAVSPLGVLNRTRRGPRMSWRIALVIAAVAAAGWAQWQHQSDVSASESSVVQLCVVVTLSLFAVAAMVGVVTDRIARRWSGGSLAGQLGRRRIMQDGSTTTRSAAALATVLSGFVVLMTVLSGTHYADLQTQTAGVTTFWGSAPNLTSSEWDRLQTSLDNVPGVRSAYLVSVLGGSATAGRPQLTVATCEAIQLMITNQSCRDGDSFRVNLPDQPRLPAAPYHLQLGNGPSDTWTPPAATRLAKALPFDPSSGLQPTDFLLTPAAAEQQFPGLLPQLGFVQIVVDMPISSIDGAQRAVSFLGWRGYEVISLSAATSLSSSPVPWIRAGLLGCGLLTLLICALGQALMGAEQISERRRAFALARASGVPLSVLGRSVLNAALLPVAVGVVLAAGTSAVLAPYVQYLRGSMWLPPTWSWILFGSAAAIVVTLVVALGSNITLRSTTGPAAFRTE